MVPDYWELIFSVCTLGFLGGEGLWYLDLLYSSSGGAGISILPVLVRDFNPVWSAYVVHFSTASPVIISVESTYCFSPGSLVLL